MTSWLNAYAAVIAVTVPVVGFVFTFTANRRAQYDRVLMLTAESGALPLAGDRHTIGLVFEPTSKLAEGQPVTLTGDQIAALFRVLWYFDRVDGVYRSLRPPLHESRITRTRSLVLDTIGGMAQIWVTYLGYAIEDEASRPVETADSVEGLRHLSQEYARLWVQRERKRRSRNKRCALQFLLRCWHRSLSG